MTNLPISSKYLSQANEPVTDDEREDLSRRLNEEFTKGTIPADHYPQLLDRVFEARTLGELVPVVEALPVKPTHQQPAMVVQDATVPPGEVSPSRSAARASLLLIGGSFLVGLVAIIALVMLIL